MEVLYKNPKTKTENTVEVKSLESAMELEDSLNDGKYGEDRFKVYIVDYPFTDKISETTEINHLKTLLNPRWDKNLLAKHIEMLEHGRLTDDEFWELVEKLRWTEDLDYKRIRKELESGTYGTRGFQLAAADKFYELKKNLKDAIDEQLEKKGLSYTKTIGLGDDGFDDLCSNIIGMGREAYEKALKNPKFAGKQGAYESFSYSFLYED